MKNNNWIWLPVTTGVVVTGLIGTYLLTRPETVVVRAESYQVTAASGDQLAQVAGLRIFFAHQSVGQNIIDAVPAIYSSAGVDAPEIIRSEEPQTVTGGYLQHVNIGTNGDPLGKIAEFDRIIRGGVGDEVDVAALKLCYVDFHSGVEVSAIFDAYRSTLADLERDYPNVTFVYMTAPLTTDRGPLKRVKARLGLDNSLSPEDNVVREEFNTNIRAEYSKAGRLFDIAAVQATASDGTRLLRSYQGANYYAMEDSLSSDPGHLSADGAVVVGGALFETIARVAGIDSP